MAGGTDRANGSPQLKDSTQAGGMLSWIPTSERTPRRIAFTHSKGSVVCCRRMHRVGTLGGEPHWATPSERAGYRAERASPGRERVVPQSPPAKRNRLRRTCRPQPAFGTVGADPARSPPNTRGPTPAARGRRWFGPDGRSEMGVQSHTRLLSRAFRAYESMSQVNFNRTDSWLRLVNFHRGTAWIPTPVSTTAPPLRRPSNTWHSSHANCITSRTIGPGSWWLEWR